jgi:predicted nucleic acid-binding protein
VLDQDLRAKVQLTRVLMHRAVELTFETAVIACDALFVALAEDVR